MKLKLQVFLVAAMILPIGLFACAAGVTPVAQTQGKFEYEMTQDEIEALESKVAGLKKGASLNEVMSLLGKPTSEQVLHSKPLFGKGRFVARVFTYVLKRVRAKDTNVRDHVISISFDENGKLTRIARLGYSKTSTFKIVGGVQIVEVILE